MSEKTYYFTFGQSHKHPETKESMKDYWIEIKAKNFDIARNVMIKRYGNKWATQYHQDDWKPDYFSKGCYEKLRVIE